MQNFFFFFENRTSWSACVLEAAALRSYVPLRDDEDDDCDDDKATELSWESFFC